jgi:lincosamide nucleotidyltransferase A/C/D/E
MEVTVLQSGGQTWLMPITAEDVLEIVTVLQSAGVRLWLDGGWGVDALLAEQTRPLADLDIAVAAPARTSATARCRNSGG